jgi:hypothetical protein
VSIDTIDLLRTELRGVAEECAAREDRTGYFAALYTLMTERVRNDLAANRFRDGDRLERLACHFASRYLDALERHRAGEPAPHSWTVAFEAADRWRPLIIQHLMLGMNAHINFDLPLALLEVIPDPDWADHDLLDRRRTDHHRIDDILASRVTTEDRRLAEIEQPGDRTILDRVLTPFNRFGTRRFLAEARRKVWNNAHRLAVARRRGHLDDLVAELEALSHRRIEDLLRPGQVILELTRNGFGVELP